MFIITPKELGLGVIDYCNGIDPTELIRDIVCNIGIDYAEYLEELTLFAWRTFWFSLACTWITLKFNAKEEDRSLLAEI